MAKYAPSIGDALYRNRHTTTCFVMQIKQPLKISRFEEFFFSSLLIGTYLIREPFKALVQLYAKVHNRNRIVDDDDGG